MLVLLPSGSPSGSPAQHPAYFVCPTQRGEQLTAVSTHIALGALDEAWVIIPLSGATARQVLWSPRAAAVVARAVACFPCTVPLPSRRLDTRGAPRAPSASDEEEGEEDEEGSAGSSEEEGRGGGAPDPPASALHFEVLTWRDVLEQLPDGVVGVLRELYPPLPQPSLVGAPAGAGGRLHYCFGVGRTGGGLSRGSTLPVSFACVHPSPDEGDTLWVPTGQGTGGGAPLLKWDATVVSVGTARRADWSGGGKAPSQMASEMRARHASGTFTATLPPSLSWDACRVDPACMPEEVTRVFTTQGVGDVAGSHAGALTGVPTFPRALWGPGAGEPPLDVLRLRKVLMAPDRDLRLRLDDGTASEEGA